jgi:sterol desaturase/sphingolipid hydroxylase (fatty acid hydroxylase superfamily)
MAEITEGTRDERGEYHPQWPPAAPPIWDWPPRPLVVLKWFFGNPGYLFPWNVMAAGIAILTWLYTQPELSRMAELEIGWIVQIYVRNLILLVVFTGALHLWLYTFKAQGERFKLHPQWWGEKKPKFLFGNQALDNVFWSIISGCTVWSAYEVLLMWSYANGVITMVTWESNPASFAVLLALLLLWQTFHFYFTHRAMHWKPLYRNVHYLHHKNINVGPWTGLAMHPVEHVVFFSAVLLLFVVPSHPIHAMFTLQLAALMTAVGHIGFEKIETKTKIAFPSDYFHFLHHRHFECNYGNTLFPFDRWFGTFHDGSPETHALMKERIRARRTTNRETAE